MILEFIMLLLILITIELAIIITFLANSKINITVNNRVLDTSTEDYSQYKNIGGE